MLDAFLLTTDMYYIPIQQAKAKPYFSADADAIIQYMMYSRVELIRVLLHFYLA